MTKMLEEKDKLLLETQEKFGRVERQNENLLKQITEMKIEVLKANESKERAERELSETVNKCDVFFNQVMGLYQKKLESEKEISALKRSNENLRAQLSEKEMMLQDQVSFAANNNNNNDNNNNKAFI